MSSISKKRVAKLLRQSTDADWGWQGRGKPLLPYPSTIPCVQCGYCCKQSACYMGQWDEEKGCCSSLVDLGNGKYACAVYQAILDSETKDWVISPAFGCGCTSPGNPDRRK